MIRKRVLLEQSDLHARELVRQQAEIEAMQEGLGLIEDALDELKSKVKAVGNLADELKRIIEEDFLPDDSEYRKMKENADLFMVSVNNILTYGGGGSEVKRE